MNVHHVSNRAKLPSLLKRLTWVGGWERESILDSVKGLSPSTFSSQVKLPPPSVPLTVVFPT